MHTVGVGLLRLGFIHDCESIAFKKCRVSIQTSILGKNGPELQPYLDLLIPVYTNSLRKWLICNVTLACLKISCFSPQNTHNNP